jgi:hypothetical protein
MTSNAIAALAGPRVPREVRLAVFVLVIAAAVTSVELAMAAWWPGLHTALGIFLPLIVTNCLVLARAESFASRESLHRALLDGFAMGLGFLLVLTGQSSWNAWRAVRDQRAPARYYGVVYWLFAAVCGLGGAGIVALGVESGTAILQAFGAVGIVAAWGSLRSWQRWRAGRAPANWWLREHYGAILGNGIATHIAFLGIGLRNALPFIEPSLRMQLTWLLPLVVAVLASAYLNRKYGRGARRASPARAIARSRSTPAVAAIRPDSAG